MPLDEQILQRLRDNDKTLTSLNLRYNKISTAEAKEIAQSLASNTFLMSLYLGDNPISDAGAKEIAQALASNTSLGFLYLGDSGISDTGAKDIAQALTFNSSLTSLDLRFNRISNAGVKDIAQALANNTSLASLYLAHNRISGAGAKDIAQALASNLSLTTLELERNQISNAFYKQVENSMTRNQKYLKILQLTASMQLRVGKLLLYKATSIDGKSNLFLELPLEIKEKIVTHINDKALLTGEQQRLVLNYAQGKIAPVADKLSFFKVTKCDRVRKQFNRDVVEAAF